MGGVLRVFKFVGLNAEVLFITVSDVWLALLFSFSTTLLVSTSAIVVLLWLLFGLGIKPIRTF